MNKPTDRTFQERLADDAVLAEIRRQATLAAWHEDLAQSRASAPSEEPPTNVPERPISFVEDLERALNYAENPSGTVIPMRRRDIASRAARAFSGRPLDDDAA